MTEQDVLGLRRSAGPVCGRPDCGKAAIWAWQRRATAEEAAAYAAQLSAQRAAVVTAQRDRQLLTLHELRVLQAQVPDTDPNGPAIRDAYQRRIDAEQATLEAIADPVPVPVDPTSTVAQFACDDDGHYIGEDAAPYVHDSDCGHHAGGCRCELPA